MERRIRKREWRVSRGEHRSE